MGFVAVRSVEIAATASQISFETLKVQIAHPDTPLVAEPITLSNSEVQYKRFVSFS